MSGSLKVWAVDVSAYNLWDGDSKGESLIASGLANTSEEQTKVKRYLREIDQIRSLAGKLLVRLAICSLREDLDWNQLHFRTTKEGRPFLSSPLLDFDYNITHDGDWVAIAFLGSGLDRAKALPPSVGVDVMEIHLPRFENTVDSFVDTMDMTLTSYEREWILAPYSSDTFQTNCRIPVPLSREKYDQLKKLYFLWTYKEAFTKSKGLGLSFDFQRIELDRTLEGVTLKVSGTPQQGLTFSEMVLPAGQSVIRKAGSGTGMDSLLVVAQSTEDGKVSSRRVPAAKAKQEGLLQIWTMNELVESTKGLISNTKEHGTLIEEQNKTNNQP